MRSWSRDWFSHAAGSVTLTLVTSVAVLGPELASATKPAGTLVKGSNGLVRYCKATGWIALSVLPSMSRSL
ncbi:MAG: hypothetical protein U0575_07995 [Phycisphaerales bacterium]